MICGQEKEVVIVEHFWFLFPALLQLISAKIEIFPLTEELFSAEYPVFRGYQLLCPLAVCKSVLAGQEAGDPLLAVLHCSGSLSWSKDYREVHNHERF